MQKRRCGMVLSVVLLALVAAGCSSRPREWVWATRSALPVEASLPATTQPVQPAWRTRGADEIAPGFELTLVCPNDATVSGTYRVELDGTLRLPYRVEVQAAGRSPQELGVDIAQKLRPFIKNPATTVTIKRRQYFVDVQGLVEKPGPVLVATETSLDEIIASAGGLQQTPEQRARAEFVRIVQAGSTGTFKLRDYFAGTTAGLPQWQGGERIFFQTEAGAVGKHGTVTRRYVNILGEVRSPGEYPFEYGDFYRYLIAAGGPTDRADLDNIALVRESATAVGATSFTLHEPTVLPTLEPGDTVIVKADNPSPLEKQSRLIGGFMSILTSIATVALLFVVA